MKYSLSVVVPVYNGDSMVQDFLSEIAKISQVHEVIVVDDGSQQWNIEEDDVRKEYYDQFDVIFLHHAKNRGKGAAVRSGINIAQGSHLLMLDVDCSTDTTSVQELIATSQDNPQNFICGSRYTKGSTIKKPQKKWRQKAGLFGSYVVKTLFKLRIQDTQCGAKIFPTSLIDIVKRKGSTNRWAADIEWLTFAQRNNIFITIVPVIWRDGSSSEVKPWHFIATAWDVLIIRLRSLR